MASAPVLGREVVRPERAPLALADRVLERDVEGATATGPAGGHHLLVEQGLPGRIDQRDAERGLEDVGVAGDAARVTDRGAVGRSVGEDRRQLVVVVRASLRPVKNDALAAEDGDGLALDWKVTDLTVENWVSV